MIVLWLLAAHMFGDFIIQNRWESATKLDNTEVRARHVLGYAVPFVPIAIVYAKPILDDRLLTASLFMTSLMVLHFATDSHRFRSTLGDVVQWTLDRFNAPAEVRKAWVDYLYGVDPTFELTGFPEPTPEWRLARARGVTGRTLWFPPPNPWGSAPIMIDQTLHICQLALLGSVFLR